MKRSVRPFLVEVKRTKRSASPGSGPSLMFPEEQVSSSHGPTTPDQELIARIFSGPGPRETPRAPAGHVDESAARAPRILESLPPADEVVVASEPETDDTGADEEEAPFGWLVYRREHGGGRAPRRPRPPAPAAVAEPAERPGVVVKARRGRPPRSAASAPRVLDPAIWSEGLGAAPAHPEETAPPQAPAVEAAPVVADAQPRVRRARAVRSAVTVEDRAERPVARAAAQADKATAAPAPAAAAPKENEGRRAVAAVRRRGSASAELPAGQRWKKRLPKVLW